jgi:hypothetical protein
VSLTAPVVLLCTIIYLPGHKPEPTDGQQILRWAFIIVTFVFSSYLKVGQVIY